MCGSGCTEIILRPQLMLANGTTLIDWQNYPHSSFLIYRPMFIVTLHYHYVSIITVSIITITTKPVKTIPFTWQTICQQWTVLCGPHWPFYEFVFLLMYWLPRNSRVELFHHETCIYYRHFKGRIFFMFSWLLWQLWFSFLQNPSCWVNEGQVLGGN